VLNTATSTATSEKTPTRTPTNTPVPAISATPPPSPTHCVTTFSDVPEGSVFYPSVRCLTCMGITSGYSDNTFRPGNDVTRGQLSKIVANAAGYSEAIGTQSFQDVPVGSTFHLFIERMAIRGIIGGYPCGGANEPCIPSQNLPYFRPGNNATRGQIAKIVSNAVGFTSTPNEQIFEDVPPSSLFYDWIQRLAAIGVMGGYRCGGPGEPCLPPQNRPYFRSYNNATRGQTAKIVTNSFFPNCNPAVSTRTEEGRR
jgi:hypothetical protein